MLDLKNLLKTAIQRKASDLHLKVGALPHYRVQGELVPFEASGPVTKEDTLDLAQHLLNTRQRQVLAEKSEVDLSFGISGVGRFRLAVFQQRGSISLVFRVIAHSVPTLEELHLPPVLRKISDNTRGLVLVTGSTGSGKSTTLAAMIQHINETRRAHIITIEDPVEYLLRDQVALISQREISVDTETFAGALRAALRQDPDVIMVGEMRDLETVQTALQASETGHLVMSTLHTTDTIETVHRVVSLFPANQQQDIRLRFSSSLKGVISMRLIRSSVSGGRIPAVEILRNTDAVRALLEQPGREREIRKLLETGYSEYGMQTFDQSIYLHYKDGLIDLQDALTNATSREDLKLRIEGVVSSAEHV